MTPPPVATAGSLRGGSSRTAFKIDRRTVAFVGVGVAAYLLALVWTLPATIVIPRSDSVIARAGTIWSGEAALAGGDRLRWKWAPLRSLASFGFAADWQLTGPETDLAGRAVAYPSGVTLDTVSGSAGGSLIEAVAPYLPFRCSLAMQVTVPAARFAERGTKAEGEARSDSGTCRLKLGSDPGVAVPALFFAAKPVGEDTVLTLAPLTERRRQLVVATLSGDGRMKLTVTPEGAKVLPFTSPPGTAGVTIETHF